ncbi:MAG: hypothetical protein II613_03880 [Bacteroidales bacterium]|nr:hypothetical protein [Bacteroidales bacterium]
MKKVRIFTFLFFVAAAVIFTQASYCDQNDSPTSIRIKSLIDRVTLGEGGSATISFVASSNSTAVKSFSFTASAQGVKITDITTKGNTCSVTVEQPETTTAKTLTTKADDVAVGSVTVTVTGALMNDGRVVLYTNGGGASAVCYVYAGDDEDDDDDEGDDEDEDEKTGLDLAASLEENTLFYDGVVLPAGDGGSGYICWHPYYSGGETITHYQLHTMRDDNGVEIVITPDMLGTPYDMLTQAPLTKMGMLVEMCFVSLMDPTQPKSADNPAFVYSTLPDQTDFEIEEALARCDHNTSDDTFSFIGYMRSTDGSEFYCNLRVPPYGTAIITSK